MIGCSYGVFALCAVFLVAFIAIYFGKISFLYFDWPQLLAIEINSYEAHMNDLMLLNDTASQKVEISTNLSLNLQAAKSECESGKIKSGGHMCPMNWDAPICYTPTGEVQTV